MKKAIQLVGVIAVCLASCNKDTKTVAPLTKEAIAAKVDSITEIRFREMEANSNRDLGYRLKIEVKAKADSILNARHQ